MPKTVNLTWNNASSGITEQLVERSVTDGAFVQIGTTTPNQNSFTDNVDEFIGEIKLSYKVSSNYIHEGTAYSASSSIFDIVINQSAASNEMIFSTTNGSLSYKGNSGDVITLSDGTTYTVLEDGGYSNENVPDGKHKVVLAKTRNNGRVSIGGTALTELHNFPTLSTVTSFNFYPDTPSPNLVKVPAVLPNNITSLGQMFYNCSAFNQDISMWNTGNVTDMSYMFTNTNSFNQPIGNWDVSKVTNMSYLFANTSAFNQPIDSWNVSAVSNMENMFSSAKAFNQPLDNWDVSSVVTTRSMFASSVAFNQDLPNWNVSNLIIMDSMFSYSEAFNGNISNWNTGNVIEMRGLLRGAKAFNQPLNEWNTSKVTDMSWMFANNTAFDQPLDSWNTGAVTSMQGMFNNNNKFDKPIGSWNVSNVNYMDRMFQGSTYLNRHDLSQWCVGRIGGTPPDFCPNNYSYQNWPVWGTCPRGENVQQ